jgi:peptidoglycan/xylan/chitin deacetylase (PgdA/CDA1 family)
MGLKTIQWSVDSIDWKDISAKEIVSRVVKKTKSGSIILCHNNGL